MIRAILTLCLAAICLGLQPAAAALRPTDLRCESRRASLSLESLEPHLSWVLESTSRQARGQSQTAYHVLVASTLDELRADLGNLWDSGKVGSDQSVRVRYRGRPLPAGAECFWKVRVWDQDGQPSAWSRPAPWIGPERGRPRPQHRESQTGGPNLPRPRPDQAAAAEDGRAPQAKPTSSIKAPPGLRPAALASRGTNDALRPDPDRPDFKHFFLRPTPVDGAKFGKAAHHSPYGLIASEWRREGGVFQWKITVPPNTSATVFVPARNVESVTESGRPVALERGVKFLRMEEGSAVFRLGSGRYSFTSR